MCRWYRHIRLLSAGKCLAIPSLAWKGICWLSGRLVSGRLADITGRLRLYLTGLSLDLVATTVTGALRVSPTAMG